MKDMIIGVDLAKRIFQVHGAARSGDVLYIAPPAGLREGGAQISPASSFAGSAMGVPALGKAGTIPIDQAASSSVAACFAPMWLNSQSAASCA